MRPPPRPEDVAELGCRLLASGAMIVAVVGIAAAFAISQGWLS